jgi:hypothetical protein
MCCLSEIGINTSRGVLYTEMYTNSKPMPIKTANVNVSSFPYPSPVSPTGFQNNSGRLKAHDLPSRFKRKYIIGDELGFGGFGFVYTVKRISDGMELACKFIYKHQIAPSSWVQDKKLGVVPMEVAVLYNVFQNLM